MMKIVKAIQKLASYIFPKPWQQHKAKSIFVLKTSGSDKVIGKYSKWMQKVNLDPCVDQILYLENPIGGM